MKKLIMFLIIFLSGCTIKYNINIQEDLTIKEKVLIDKSNAFEYAQREGHDSVESYINTELIEASETIEEEGYKLEDLNNYIQIENERHLSELNNKNLIDVFSNFYSECNNERCKIIGVANKNPNFLRGDYIISINLKNKVIHNNADEINLINDTYIWYYNSDQQSDIELVFKKHEFNLINFQKIIYYSSIIIRSILVIFIIGFILKFLIKLKQSTNIN